MNKKTLIFVPTYEEADNVGPMVEQLSAAMPEADLLFCDDSSPDGTGEKLDALKNAFPRLSVKHRPGKLGIGGAHHDGIAYAYDHGYDVLVTLDCDFTHSPSDVPLLVERIDDADVVVGSRYLERDSLPGWSLARRFLTGFGHVLTVNMLGVHGDATGAFRVYNLRRVPREMFALVKSRGYSFFFESLYVIQRNELKVVEVPIKLPARTAGHSKMDVKEIARSVRQLAELSFAHTLRPDQFRLSSRRK
jgi:dolichol-phosphate mannosyltransferase